MLEEDDEDDDEEDAPLMRVLSTSAAFRTAAWAGTHTPSQCPTASDTPGTP